MPIDYWFIGGGAEHSPESARRQLNASTGGAEGVGGVNDLKVVPLEVPGQGVRVLVGSALMLSRFVGGETQTYMGTVYEQESTSISPTGSGTGRSDLVVLRVEDPHAAGSPFDIPGDPSVGPYIFVRVISGVPSSVTRLQDVPGHKNDTGIALARIDLPPSTGTVDDVTGKIVDLREIAQPRSDRVLRVQKGGVLVDGGWDEAGNVVEPAWERYPQHDWLVRIPEWATQVQVAADWLNMFYKGPDGITGVYDARGRLRIGLIAGSDSIYTDAARYNFNPNGLGNGYRASAGVRAQINIPAAMRGRTAQLRMYASGTKQANGAPLKGRLVADDAAQFSVDLQFNEIAAPQAEL